MSGFVGSKREREVRRVMEIGRPQEFANIYFNENFPFECGFPPGLRRRLTRLEPTLLARISYKLLRTMMFGDQQAAKLAIDRILDLEEEERTLLGYEINEVLAYHYMKALDTESAMQEDE